MFLATLQFRLDHPSHDTRSYRVSVGPADFAGEPTHVLRQHGPVHNNVIRYSGSFATVQAAKSALADHLAADGKAVVEHEDALAVVGVAYLRKNQRAARRAWPSEQLLAALS